MVLSTALFDKPAYKNLICNGLVLAKDGKKMSKRLKNYPDPMEVVNECGADAVRVYLMNSPVTNAKELSFDRDGVRDVVKDIFIPWWNSYKFFIEQSIRYESKQNQFVYEPENVGKYATDIVDKWILSKLQTLVKGFRKEMDAYKLYNVIPNLLQFIEELSKWYIRLHRDALKGSQGQEQAHKSLHTLLHCLIQLNQIMAPFTPFLVENMYQNLKSCLKDPPASIHFMEIPSVDESLIHSDIENQFANMQQVIVLGRQCRDARTLSFKYPCASLMVLSNNKSNLTDISENDLTRFIEVDLNVRKVTFSSQMFEFIKFEVIPDARKLGTRLKKKASSVKKALTELSHDDLTKFKDSGSIEVEGETVTLDEVEFIYKFSGDTERYQDAQNA
eukprot:UN24525